MNYETFVDWARENLTEEDIDDIKSIINTDRFPYSDIYEIFADAIFTIKEFYGECASDCRFRYDYIYTRYEFEKDYFSSWLEGCAVYPNTYEIIDQCQYIQEMIELWERAVEKDWIDGEEGWIEKLSA